MTKEVEAVEISQVINTIPIYRPFLNAIASCTEFTAGSFRHMGDLHSGGQNIPNFLCITPVCPLGRHYGIAQQLPEHLDPLILGNTFRKTLPVKPLLWL